MTVLQIKYPSSLPALLWLRRNGVDLCKYTVSWLQQPKKHSLCWVCVPTKDFLWILRDKAIAELTLPFCHYNPGSYEALVGFWVFFPLRSTWWVPRLSEKVKQHIKPVPHKRSVLYRVCYCALLFPLQKRQPEHGEYSSLHKNTTGKVFSAQELQNPTQVMSYILWKERQDSQPPRSNIG